ncbi:MAG: hypothetical protein AB7G13_06830 [Lautropia sp.]
MSTLRDKRRVASVAEQLAADGAGIAVEDDYDAINRLYLERAWTDGLPIVPPTAERIAGMLAYCSRSDDQPLVEVAPRYGAGTRLRIAANAVMAGCRPEYFPVVVLALRCMAEDRFNSYGLQTTTHPGAPLIIVNGPISRELGINSGHNAFGPGVQANATIGRAVSLCLRNIGGAYPGSTDMSTFGTPAKYSYCVAENEAANPWEPLHVELGFAADSSTVTVVAAEAPHNVNDHQSLTGEGVLKMVAGTMSITGSNDIYYTQTSQPVVALGPEHAALVAASGFSKADVKRFLYDHARVPLSRFSDENIRNRLRQNFPGRYADSQPDAPVPMFQAPELLMLLVLGGAGKHSMFIPSFGITNSVTRALTLPDGSPARSIEEFRQG